MAVTLATCDKHELLKLAKRLHPARDRRELIFAAGTLNNTRLQKDLGSAELCTFYDGMVAAGLLESNPYWPHYAKEAR